MLANPHNLEKLIFYIQTDKLLFLWMNIFEVMRNKPFEDLTAVFWDNFYYFPCALKESKIQT